jgi:hypothetical protein
MLRCNDPWRVEIAPTIGALPAISRIFKSLGLTKLSALEAADMSASAGPPAGDHGAAPI